MATHARAAATNPLEVFLFLGVGALVLEGIGLWRRGADLGADPIPLLRVGSDVLFIALYLARSRYAWHALLYLGLVATPGATLIAQRDLLFGPEQIERTVAGLVVVGALIAFVARQRERYFAHIERSRGGS